MNATDLIDNVEASYRSVFGCKVSEALDTSQRVRPSLNRLLSALVDFRDTLSAIGADSTAENNTGGRPQ